jgi:hypothetical protein
VEEPSRYEEITYLKNIKHLAGFKNPQGVKGVKE